MSRFSCCYWGRVDKKTQLIFSCHDETVSLLEIRAPEAWTQQILNEFLKHIRDCMNVYVLSQKVKSGRKVLSVKRFNRCKGLDIKLVATKYYVVQLWS